MRWSLPSLATFFYFFWSVVERMVAGLRAMAQYLCACKLDPLKPWTRGEWPAVVTMLMPQDDGTAFSVVRIGNCLWLALFQVLFIPRA